MHAHTASCENEKGKTNPVVNDVKEDVGKTVETEGKEIVKGGKEAVKAYDAVVDLLGGQ